MKVNPITAQFSARAQQLLLAQGARYVSNIGEADWKRIPVMLELTPHPAAPLSAAAARLAPLPLGSWLVLPWDEPRPERLEALLDTMQTQLGRVPDQVLMVTSLGHVSEGWLTRLSQRYGARFAAVQAATFEVAGPEALARPLSVIFQEETGEALAGVNPLAHMSHLADPRNLDIFVERLHRATPRAVATRALMTLNIVVFVVMLLSTAAGLFSGFSVEDLTGWGANVSRLTVDDGQWWRMLSCTFVHANLLHIGMNMWALHALGEMAERLFGSVMFVAVYLLAGLGGSVASLAFTLAAHPSMPSIGASGAVFGIMGGLLGFMVSRRGSVPRPLYKSMITNAVSFIGLNLFIGLSIPAIDNAAHMGGLAAGVLAGALLSRDLPPAPQPAVGRRAGGIVAVLVVLGLGIATL